jgi:hypothetical protein
MNRFKVNRRTVLRGVIGGLPVAIALPPLEAMIGGGSRAWAQAQAARPRRLGLWFWGNGVKMPQWRPVGAGAGWAPNLSTQPLADAAIKDYVNIVTGMDVKAGNERGHHSGVAALFSGSAILPQDHPNSNYKSTFRQPSLDKQLATELMPNTKFATLEVGVSNKVAQGEGTTTTYLSHSGPDSPNPAEYDAGKVFDRVFAGVSSGGGTPPPPVTDASKALRQSVLDAVKIDIGRLQTRVGAQDKQRLDQHLTNIRAIEQQIAQAGGSSTVPLPANCGSQTKPIAIADSRQKEDVVKRNQIMSDLLAVTLACDLTRIFSVHFSGAFGYTVYWQADAAITSGHHDLTHNEAADQPQVQESTTFIMSQLAYFLKKLKSTADVDGRTLLDNIVILGSTDVSDGKTHSVSDYPIVIAGGGSGNLKNPGIHYQSSKENTSNVLLTVMRAAGSSVSSVGTDKGLSTTPCIPIQAV